MDFVSTILGGPLKDGKNVKHTANGELWYKIVQSTKTLYLPTIEVLRVNVAELDRSVEALQSFNTIELDTLCSYRWDEEYIESITVPDSVIRDFANYSGPKLDVAFDIETCHVGYNDNRVLAVGMCWEKEGLELVATFSGTVSELQQVFSNPNLNCIWHNGKFDTSRLEYLEGVKARVDDDTMLMHYIGINEKKGTHSLKTLGQLYLQSPAWDDELDEYKKKWCRENGIRLKDFTYDMIPVSILIPYLKRDVLATYRLAKLFRRLMRPESVAMYRNLVEASNTYRKIELNGVKLNKPHLAELKVELQKQAAESMEIADSIIREHWDYLSYCKETGAAYSRAKSAQEFSMRSPKKLKWMIEKLVGFPVNSTSKEVLEELAEHMETIQNEEGKQFIAAITSARKASKYYDTYAIGLETLCCDDGRIRCSYNLHGTETGRLSSTDPNMQNIPRNSKIKDLITCEEGNTLVQLDYSQAELRVLTALSGDPYLLEIYTSGKDLHDMMATKMFGPGFTKEQRVITKSLNFGIAYGRGPQSIAKMFKLSMAEAQKTVRDWYAAVPEVEKFIAAKRKEPFQGETCKTPFGRERHFVITSENKYHVSNEAINFPIQSIASDLTLLSVLEIQRWIEQMGYSDIVKIVATVHDSIVMEVKDDPELISEVAHKGAAVMRDQPKKYNIGIVDVPFRADAEVGKTWGGVKPYEANK